MRKMLLGIFNMANKTRQLDQQLIPNALNVMYVGTVSNINIKTSGFYKECEHAV